MVRPASPKQVRDDALVLSDLRVNSEPDYSFNFAVAREKNEMDSMSAAAARFEWKMRRGWGDLWNRIWHQPPGHLIQNAIARACTKA